MALRLAQPPNEGAEEGERAAREGRRMARRLDDCVRVPLATVTSSELATAMNETFAGYVVPVHVTPEAAERRFREEDLDPFASAIYRYEGANAAILFVARRGWTARIAAMGVAPPFRRLGIGRAALVQAIEESIVRRERRIVLECYETNHPAIALYEGLGFVVRRRLVGFTRPSRVLSVIESRSTDPALPEIDASELARRIVATEDEALPWQLSAATLSALVPPHRAFGSDEAIVALSDTQRADVRLVGLYVAPAARRQGHASRLLGLLDLYFPSHTLRIPPIVPEGLADEFFACAGWRHSADAQVEMIRDLG